jgi:Spy/CpxP family protein refolding chaperone
MGRTIGVLLALSLAANVFLGGFVAGRIAAPNLPGFDRAVGARALDGHGSGPRRGFDELPPAAREKMRAAFKEKRAEFAASFREARALREEFARILTAETFDRAAAEAVAAKIEAFEDKRRRSSPRLVIEMMDGLPVEDRRALAALVESRIMGDLAGQGARRRRGGRRDGQAPDDSQPTE